MKHTTLAGLAVALAAPVMLIAAPAQAHTPDISASCDGVVLKATAYDSGKANTWTVTVDGKTESGTFGASLSKTIKVPQAGATSDWSASIASHDSNPQYGQTKSGKVGPCGTPAATTVTVPDLAVTPPTCDTDGTLPLTFWPAAQNANGYEGDGFRVYLNKAYTGPGTYIATLQKVGPGFDPKYPGGTKVTGNLTQTLVVEGRLQFADCNEPPAPKVVVTEAELVKCESDTVVKTITTTTTPPVLNEAGDAYVDGVPVVTTTEKTRPATDTECPPVVEPPVVVPPVVEPPVVEPPVEPPVVEPPVVEPPAAPPVVEPPAKREPRIGTPVSAETPVVYEEVRTLPNTGASSFDREAGVLAGVLLVGAGLVVTLFARRRRSI